MTYLSLGAVFLTTRESPRVPILHRMLKSLSASQRRLRYYFVNWSATNLTDPPSLAPPARYEELVRIAMDNGRPWLRGRKSPELFAKLFFALDFYLQNSTDRWFFRGNDDTIVNLPLLPDYLQELESKHNPLVDFVALGNCIVTPVRQWPYPQGGAGYLFSRVACRRLAEMARQIMADGWGDEDAVVGEVLHDLGVTNITSDRFLGYTIDEQPRDCIVRGAYKLLPKCSVIEHKGGCAPFLSPLRNIVFFHQHLPFDYYYAKLVKMTFAAPPDIMWWVSGFHPHLFKATLTPRPGF
jgi:hypothetical protein